MMIRVKVVIDFEKRDGFSLAREIEVGLPDETIAEIARVIAAEHSAQGTGDDRKARGVLKNKGIDPVADIRKLRGD